MFLLQEQPWIFAIITFIVIVIRVLLEYVAVVFDPQSLQEIADALDEASEPGLWDRVPRIAQIVIESAVAVILLGGLLPDWPSTLLPFLVLLGIGLARWFLSARVPIWSQIMSHIPPILRIAAMLVLGYLLSSFMLQGRLRGASFEPVVMALLVSLGVAAIFFPESPQMQRDGVTQ
jgi:hypothetical protein